MIDLEWPPLLLAIACLTRAWKVPFIFIFPISDRAYKPAVFPFRCQLISVCLLSSILVAMTILMISHPPIRDYLSSRTSGSK